jgi:hypothetical protein
MCIFMHFLPLYEILLLISLIYRKKPTVEERVARAKELWEQRWAETNKPTKVCGYGRETSLIFTISSNLFCQI